MRIAKVEDLHCNAGWRDFSFLKITTDEGILDELAVYNPMIPEPGQLCATLFLELTSDEQVREWLPKLVGVERSILFELPDGDTVRCDVEEQHAGQLTRGHTTAAVHFLQFRFTPEQVAAFGPGTRLAIDHPAHRESVELGPPTLAELKSDLTGIPHRSER